jgi:hypothetical protein
VGGPGASKRSIFSFPSSLSSFLTWSFSSLSYYHYISWHDIAYPAHGRRGIKVKFFRGEGYNNTAQAAGIQRAIGRRGNTGHSR